MADVDSELFEHVTYDASELLEYHHALRPKERAAVLEVLLRLTKLDRQAKTRRGPSPT
jgi:hypothetical protein